MKKLFIVMLICLIQACASNQFIIDQKGVDMDQYAKDLADCQSYTSGINNKTTIAKSAGAGAAIGGAVGAVVGNSDTSKVLAGTGAIKGGSSAAIRGDREKDRIVKNCLRGRGYRVLN